MFERQIADVRERVRANRRAFADSAIKEWCGLRWRNLFLQECVADDAAQRIAERFLRGDCVTEWRAEMPPGPDAVMRQTTLVFCPGLLTGLLPVQAFQTAFPRLEKRYGWRILRADAHPMRSCVANVADL